MSDQYVLAEMFASLIPMSEKALGSTTGLVVARNPDGTITVKPNGSANNIICDCSCRGAVGDRVDILTNGTRWTAIATVGGDGVDRNDLLTMLYSNPSGNTGTVTLSQPAEDFSKLRIRYGASLAVSQWITIPAEAQTNVPLSMMWTYNNAMYFLSARLTISGATITQTAFQSAMTNSTGALVAGTNTSNIYEVEGIL